MGKKLSSTTGAIVVTVGWSIMFVLMYWVWLAFTPDTFALAPGTLTVIVTVVSIATIWQVLRPHYHSVAPLYIALATHIIFQNVFGLLMMNDLIRNWMFYISNHTPFSIPVISVVLGIILSVSVVKLMEINNTE